MLPLSITILLVMSSINFLCIGTNLLEIFSIFLLSSESLKIWYIILRITIPKWVLVYTKKEVITTRPSTNTSCIWGSSKLRKRKVRRRSRRSSITKGWKISCSREEENIFFIVDLQCNLLILLIAVQLRVYRITLTHSCRVTW